MSFGQPQDYDGSMGVDLITPFPKRSPHQCQRLKNYQFLYSGSLAPRAGHQFAAASSGGLGFVEYIRTQSGVDVTTYFDIGTNLREIKNGTFLISYAGAASAVTIQHLVDLETNTFKFQVIEGDDTEVLLHDCGVGIEEASPETLADLKTAIEAISADYTVTITGDDTLPAAFLPQQVAQVLSGSPLELSIPFNYSAEYRKPAGVTNLFDGHQAARNSASFRNATFINLRNCLVVATEEDYPVKCDDNSSYRYGMAKGLLTSATPAGGAGAITAEWRYRVTYKHIDHQDNTVPGSISAEVLATPTAMTRVDLVIPQLAAASGYATNKAQVDGAQAGVTNILVDAGHGFLIGDKVTLIDRSVSARAVTRRTVTALPDATHITISGANVNVADNDIISHSLTIEIWRTKTKASFYYLVAEIPNDSAVSTITYQDTLADASLGAQYLFPTRNPDPPPKGGIITEHQGVPFITRNPAAPNRVYYAEALYPEGFPEATNFRDCRSKRGGGITALQSNIAGLEIFFPTSHYRLSGDVLDESFSYRPISLALGCVAHDTVLQLQNNQIFWVSKLGPRWMGPGGMPQTLGFDIAPLFDMHLETADSFVLEHALVVDNSKEKMLLLFLPVETSTGGNIHTTDASQIWVLDYKISDAARWCGPWDSMNMAGGALFNETDGKIRFIERRFDITSANVQRNMLTTHNRNDDFDQIDHVTPIDSEIGPGWEALGVKSVKKLFQWLRVYSNDLQRLSGFTIEIVIEQDFIESVASARFVLQFGNGGGALGWQFQPWGFFPWGNPVTTFQQATLKKPDAFALRPRFLHNVGYQKPILSLWSMLVKAPWEEGINNK